MAVRLTRRAAVQLGAVVVAGLAIGQVLRRTTRIGRDVADTGAVAAILNGRESPSSGPPGASVRLVVFSDYRCPACRMAFPELEAAIAADGDVRVIYKDWPIFGPLSERAARVALATVEQGIYPTVHSTLMTDGRALDDRVLREIVTGAGGDWVRVEAYLKAHAASLSARLRENAREAVSIGLRGTPGYLAGPTLVTGAIDRAGFARLFARARERAA